MVKKWKKLGSRVAFEDRWIKVRSDSYEGGNGKVIEPYYITEYPTWINILPITTDLNVLMLKHYRPGADEVLIEIPGGIVEGEDTSVEETARRELKEETGYGGGIFFQVGSYFANPANSNNKTTSFLAVNIEKVAEVHLDDAEDLELHTMPLTEFFDTILTNRNENIVQALHMTNLFYSLTWILKSEAEELKQIKETIRFFFFK